MKKLLLFLILLLIPSFVLAEDFEYTIKSKVTLEGKELQGEDFTFDLIDVDGNIIQTKKNDKDGNVTFDPITFTAADATDDSTAASNYSRGKNKYYFYTIKQRNDNDEFITYDQEPSYVGVYIYEDGTSTVDYLKDIEAIKKETTQYKTKENAEIYHATEEELQGQAYAVYDIDTQVLTFFRDEVGKYINYDMDDDYTKIYYTGFEEGYNPTWRRFEDHGTYTHYTDPLISVKKIVFEDPIKPQEVSDPRGRYSSWFLNMYDLEEIENINLLDTSEVTTLNYLFAYNQKIKTLDLSTWDTSNVTSMKDTFDTCYELEELYIDNFDTSKVTTTYSMFGRDYKLKWINQNIFDFSSLTQGDQMFQHVRSIKGLDLSTWGITRDDAVSSMINFNDSLIYINASTLPGLWSEAIGQNNNLAIVDLAGSYTVVHSNIGPSGAFWYNLKTQKLYTKNELVPHLTELHDLESATYIRPNHNLEPSLFRNLYTKPQTEVEGNNLHNPETGNYGLYILLIIATISGIALIIQKRKLDFLK